MLITYYSNGIIKRKENYKEGKLFNGNYFRAGGKNTIATRYEVMPEFPEGFQHFINILTQV